MSKNPCFHCVCCDSPMEPKKRKPITTWTGDMKSVYSERVESFPYEEWEDLCVGCIKVIRNYNSDLTKGMANFSNIATQEQIFPKFVPPVRIVENSLMEEECSELRMDVEFRYVQSLYNGNLDE